MDVDAAPPGRPFGLPAELLVNVFHFLDIRVRKCVVSHVRNGGSRFSRRGSVVCAGFRTRILGVECLALRACVFVAKDWHAILLTHPEPWETAALSEFDWFVQRAPKRHRGHSFVRRLLEGCAPPAKHWHPPVYRRTRDGRIGELPG
eukprot:scaffold7352_cov254-Pinguiococcus_pyrenoidosus.AAC.4